MEISMFRFNADVTPTDCEPGVTRNFHHHEHLQITYVAEGSFEFTIGGETKVVKKGDSVYMPSNVEHGVTALEDGKLVDVFNPMRQDFLK